MSGIISEGYKIQSKIKKTCFVLELCEFTLNSPVRAAQYGNTQSIFFLGFVNTPQPLNNTACYNTVLGITQFKDGSQKCINYIEK